MSTSFRGIRPTISIICYDDGLICHYPLPSSKGSSSFDEHGKVYHHTINIFDIHENSVWDIIFVNKYFVSISADGKAIYWKLDWQYKEELSVEGIPISASVHEWNMSYILTDIGNYYIFEKKQTNWLFHIEYKTNPFLKVSSNFHSVSSGLDIYLYNIKTMSLLW